MEKVKSLWEAAKGNAIWDAVKLGAQYIMLPLIGTMWGYFQSIPGPWLLGLFLWLLGAVIWVLNQWDKWKDEKEGQLPLRNLAANPWAWVSVIVFVVALAIIFVLFTQSRARDLEIANKEKLATFYRSALDPAHIEAQQILERICKGLQSKGEIEKALSGLIISHVIEETHNAKIAINNALTRNDSPGHDDPKKLQELFGEYYYRYNGLKGRILQSGDFVEFPYETDGQYQRWKEMDRRFLDRVNDIIAETDFEVLRSKISSAGQGAKLR